MKLAFLILITSTFFGGIFSDEVNIDLKTKHTYIEKENEIIFNVIGTLPLEETKIQILLSYNNILIFSTNANLKEKNIIPFTLKEYSPDKILKCQLIIKDLSTGKFNFKAELFLYGHQSIHPKIPENTLIVRLEDDYKSLLSEKLKIETIKIKDLKQNEKYELILEDIKLEALGEIIENRKNCKQGTKVFILSNCTGNVKITSKIKKIILSNLQQNSKLKYTLPTLLDNSLELDMNTEGGYTSIYLIIANIEIIFYGYPFDKEIDLDPEALLQFDKLLNNNLMEFLK